MRTPRQSAIPRFMPGLDDGQSPGELATDVPEIAWDTVNGRDNLQAAWIALECGVLLPNIGVC